LNWPAKRRSRVRGLPQQPLGNRSDFAAINSRRQYPRTVGPVVRHRRGPWPVLGPIARGKPRRLFAVEHAALCRTFAAFRDPPSPPPCRVCMGPAWGSAPCGRRCLRPNLTSMVSRFLGRTQGTRPLSSSAHEVSRRNACHLVLRGRRSEALGPSRTARARPSVDSFEPFIAHQQHGLARGLSEAKPGLNREGPRIAVGKRHPRRSAGHSAPAARTGCRVLTATRDMVHDSSRAATGGGTHGLGLVVGPRRWWRNSRSRSATACSTVSNSAT